MPTYSSYSGTDIISVFRFPVIDEPLVFGELNTISYSIYRNKFPVRALGHINPKGHTKGPRTIAGTLIFTMFNKAIINRIIKKIYHSKNFNLLPDELPPFSITMTMCNESGEYTVKSLYGVELVEENQIISAEDLQVNEQFSFVAQDIDLTD